MSKGRSIVRECGFSEDIMKHQSVLRFLAFPVFLLATALLGQAQVIQTQSAAPNSQQSGQIGDLIRDLNLTPEQREQIRGIREQSREERAGINSRLAQANLALEQALDADTPDEALVEQRMREVAAAQAALMRMRILTEIRIRRVLTGEQRNTLRLLRQQAAQLRRERFLNNPERQRRREERMLQNRRMGPLLPRQRNQRRQSIDVP